MRYLIVISLMLSAFGVKNATADLQSAGIDIWLGEEASQPERRTQLLNETSS